VTKKVLVSEDLFKRLCKQAEFEKYKVKLGRWILKEEIGEFIGRKSEIKGQIEKEQSKY
jgi:hypothetical protein